MFELKDFFKQPETESIEKSSNSKMKIHKAWENGYDISNFKMAIVGISDNRHIEKINNQQNKTLQQIRQHLFEILLPNSKLLVDLGDLIEGKTVKDSYYALSQVITTLHSKQIIPLIIGSGDDYIYGIHLSLKELNKNMKHVHVDYQFDNKQNRTKVIDRDNYFFHASKLEKTISEISILGTQAYYSDSEDFSKNNNIMFSSHRLGWIRQNLFDSEPLLRNAHIVTCDMNSIKISDNPANYLGMPNGFYAEEICQLAWYAGYSGQTSVFGVFNYFSDFDFRDTGSKLISQIIWHFIDGYMQNPSENPENGLKNFEQLHVFCEIISTDLLFIKSKKTNRYWLMIENRQEKTKSIFLPISKNDYLEAASNRISDQIIHYLSNNS